MRDGPEVLVVPTGTANLASVLAGLARAGARPRLAAGPGEVAAASHVVLPGVGALGPAMERLAGAGLLEPLRERVRAGRPLLAVCLGLQLLCEASEESPGVAALGLVPGEVRRFRGAVRIPQMGWNLVVPGPGCRYLRPGHAYFANSFRLEEAPPGWQVAHAHHGGRFVAALERGALLACQFHPELSGGWGAELLGRWLAAATDPAAPGAEEPAPPAAARDGLRARVIPCLDVKDGRVVKGVRFQGLRDAGCPVERAGVYEAQGADELVLLDVSATPEGRSHGLETVRAVRARLSLPLTVGGGVRQEADAAALLEAGADKVAVNTAAVLRPELIGELSRRFGRQCTVLALDAARREDAPGWEVVIRSGRERTGIDAVAWAREAERLGAGEVLLTSWDRDGTRAGYDLELLAAVAGEVRVPVIASGGAATPDDLGQALAHGADAVLAASLFHDGDLTVGEVKGALAAAAAGAAPARRGLEVRP